MAEIVNLRQARKRARRAESERLAAENRVRFGRTKVEKAASATEARRAEADLDGHRRDRKPDDGN